MIRAFSDDPRCNGWLFWVLELTPRCGTRDIERAAREINARLTMQLTGAEQFAIPGGGAVRDDYLVREARARLLDPATRLLCEFWYLSPQADVAAADAPARYSAEQWWDMLGRG